MKEEYAVSLFTFIGSERFQKMTRVFRHYAVGAVLVFDMSKLDHNDDEEKIEKSISAWKGEVDKVFYPDLDGEVKILTYLIGSKFDLCKHNRGKYICFFEKMMLKYDFVNYKMISSKEPSAGDNIDDFMIELIAKIMPYNIPKKIDDMGDVL